MAHDPGTQTAAHSGEAVPGKGQGGHKAGKRDKDDLQHRFGIPRTRTPRFWSARLRGYTPRGASALDDFTGEGRQVTVLEATRVGTGDRNPSVGATSPIKTSGQWDTRNSTAQAVLCATWLAAEVAAVLISISESCEPEGRYSQQTGKLGYSAGHFTTNPFLAAAVTAPCLALKGPTSGWLGLAGD
ncbi:hypothetical protein E2C01_001316 [Portunus trituberculatus]|uniref:Uncharacterized protein n=1 Tax=Portunus trituberculatus TaxID=210409 RepID=A0A5B7CM97_PORTR|nr:hypothetical protein [Portunus trituberculatus]